VRERTEIRGRQERYPEKENKNNVHLKVQVLPSWDFWCFTETKREGRQRGEREKTRERRQQRK